MMRGKIYVLLCLLLAAAPARGGADRGQAEESVAAAEEALRGAFTALVEAERAGAAVEEATRRLDGALRLLESAERLIRAGDYGAAVTAAEEVAQEAAAVHEAALAMRDSAALRAENTLRNQLVLSFSASFMVALLGYAAWFYYKRHYLGRVSGARPEAASPRGMDP